MSGTSIEHQNADHTEHALQETQTSANMAESGPYALNENGSAKDPNAFRDALRADPQRMAALQARHSVVEKRTNV